MSKKPIKKEDVKRIEDANKKKPKEKRDEKFIKRIKRTVEKSETPKQK